MPNKGRKADQTHRRLVDHIYAGALDPAGYVDIVQAWDAHYQALHGDGAAAAPGDFVWTEEFFVHFERAGVIFDRLSQNETLSLKEKAQAITCAAFVTSATGCVSFQNARAMDTFGDLGRAFLADHALDAASRQSIRDLLAEAPAHPADQARMRRVVRFMPRAEQDLSTFIVEVAADRQTGDCVLFFHAVDDQWHDAVLPVLRTSFGLTDAEAALVRRLQLGASIRQIAEATGRSAATLRTQLSSVMAKMGVNSQAALARVVSGLSNGLGPVSAPAQDKEIKVSRHSPDGQRDRTLRLRGGQSVQVVESGDLDGRPFYFIQTTTWPYLTPTLVHALTAQGIRLISPVRSGVGQTGRLSPDLTLPALAEYHREILSQLGLERLLLGGQCSGGVYALQLAALMGKACDGVVLADTGAPLRSVLRINEMPLAPRRLFLAARLFPAALTTPYKMAHADFYSGPDGEARGVSYFVEDSPHDMLSVRDPDIWQVVRDNFDYVMRNRDQAIRDVRFWAADQSKLTQDVLRTTPVTYLQGAENRLFAARHAQHMAQRHQNAHAVIVEDEAQLLIYRQPEVFAETIARAMDQAARQP